jgi:hypothetical protein
MFIPQPLEEAMGRVALDNVTVEVSVVTSCRRASNGCAIHPASTGLFMHVMRVTVDLQDIPKIRINGG